MNENVSSPKSGETNDNVEGILTSYKQKLKILKKAYLSEQEEKENYK